MVRPLATTLPSLIRERSAADPHAVAVVTPSGSATYADLLGRAQRVAGALRSAGVGPRDRVAILTDNRLEWVETAVATTALGAVLAPINTWVKRWDLEYLLDHARPTVLIVLAELGKQDFLAELQDVLPELWSATIGHWRSRRFPALRAVVVVEDDGPAGTSTYAEWSQASEPFLGDDAQPDGVAMVLYTSGSTARPKGVPLLHADLVANAFEIGARQGLGPEDRVFLASPLCWAFGSANAMMACFTAGAALVLQGQFDPASALDLMESHACTALYTLPAMSRALLAQSGARERMASVRRGVTIGPPVEVRLVREDLGVDLICNIYGSTEVYGNCCVTPSGAASARRASSQGPPLPGVEVRIGSQGSAPGTIGEIFVRGRITPGYLDPQGVPVPVVDQDGWFATGDLGSLDGESWLTFAARETDMIKTSGINVSPSEVEDFLMSHPGVEEVAVAGGDDPVRGQRVVAFVKRSESSDTTAEQLREYCRQSIAGYKVPAVVRLVRDFPTTQTGKLSRKDLSALATTVLAEP